MTIDPEKLREMLESTSPRPWRADDVIVRGPSPESVCDCSFETALKGATLDAARSDAALIAAAVNALPALLDVFEAVKAWVDYSREVKKPDFASSAGFAIGVQQAERMRALLIEIRRVVDAARSTP